MRIVGLTSSLPIKSLKYFNCSDVVVVFVSIIILLAGIVSSRLNKYLYAASASVNSPGALLPLK